MGPEYEQNEMELRPRQSTLVHRFEHFNVYSFVRYIQFRNIFVSTSRNVHDNVAGQQDSHYIGSQLFDSDIIIVFNFVVSLMICNVLVLYLHGYNIII